MSNSSSLSEEATSNFSTTILPPPPLLLPLPAPPSALSELERNNRKSGLLVKPDPDVEVVALTAEEIVATNKFVCEVCHKGFQRDQNLQLHRRGHNLPWRLKKEIRSGNEQAVRRKKVYVCPEPTCPHHRLERALGDLTGIKKHFCRKHGEKKWKCEKCFRFYAVMSDFRAHSKTCGTREYRCGCGLAFSRKDSLLSHSAFCEALAEETARMRTIANQVQAVAPPFNNPQLARPSGSSRPLFPYPRLPSPQNRNRNRNPNPNPLASLHFPPLTRQNPNSIPNNTLISNAFNIQPYPFPNPAPAPPFPNLSGATTLVPEGAMFGPRPHQMAQLDMMMKYDIGALQFMHNTGGQTRDFLGLRGQHGQGINNNQNGKAAAQVSMNMGDILNCTGVHMGPINPSYGDQGYEFSGMPNIGYGMADSAASKMWG